MTIKKSFRMLTILIKNVPRIDEKWLQLDMTN